MSVQKKQICSWLSFFARIASCPTWSQSITHFSSLILVAKSNWISSSAFLNSFSRNLILFLISAFVFIQSPVSFRNSYGIPSKINLRSGSLSLVHACKSHKSTLSFNHKYICSIIPISAPHLSHL